MVYEILNYKKYKNRINSLLANNNGVNKNVVVKVPSLDETRFGYEIEHYTIGHGENHIVVMGGTHGNEIISVDFVTQLMKEIAEGKGEFEDFDPNEFTLHFIPLQNPEGFIISTSAIATEMLYAEPFEIDKISNEGNVLTYEDPYKSKLLSEIQKVCKKYYLAFRQDDIDARNNVNTTGTKHHHYMFPRVSSEIVEDDFLSSNIKDHFGEGDFPAASLVDWRANGSGIDLNANTPHHKKALAVQKDGQVLMGSMRFNTIRNYVFGPLGTATLEADKFGYEPENIMLFNLLEELYSTGKYAGMLTYHGTGGMVYNRPHETHLAFDESSESQISREVIAYINDKLADSYSGITTYRKLEAAENTGVGDLIRSNYPGELLIELSKMGGNPLGPYGDIFGNYKNVLRDNMKAFATYIKECKLLKSYMYAVSPEEKEYDAKTGMKF